MTAQSNISAYAARLEFLERHSRADNTLAPYSWIRNFHSANTLAFDAIATSKRSAPAIVSLASDTMVRWARLYAYEGSPTGRTAGWSRDGWPVHSSLPRRASGASWATGTCGFSKPPWTKTLTRSTKRRSMQPTHRHFQLRLGQARSRAGHYTPVSRITTTLFRALLETAATSRSRTNRVPLSPHLVPSEQQRGHRQPRLPIPLHAGTYALRFWGRAFRYYLCVTFSQ